MKIKRFLALILTMAALLTMSSFGALSSMALASGAFPSGAGNELTWAASFQDIMMPEELGYLELSALTENGFYAFSSELTDESTEDGSGTYEARILFVGFDGIASRLENYELLSPAGDLTGKYDYSFTAAPQYVLPLNTGDLAVIESVSESWVSRDGLTYDDEEYWQYYSFSQNYFFRLLNADGSEKLCRQIPLGEDQYLTSAVSDRDGSIVCLSGDTLLVLSPEGELLRTFGNGWYFDSLVSLRSGALFATAWGESGVELYPVDAQRGEFGRARKLPKGAYRLFPGGGEYPLYYSDGSSFYGLDLESGKSVKLFSWLGTDVAPDLYSDFGVMDDGSVAGVIYENENSSTDEYAYRLFEVKQVPASTVREKKTLTLAVQWMNYDAGRTALRFNRSSEDYRIEILDYSVYNTEDDYAAGMKKLLEDVMNGNMPDILELDGLPVSRLAAAGLLEDLYPYMDADPELSRENFFPNVLALCEQDGRLVSTVSGFALSTLIGASSVVGDTPGWTYEACEAALASMPQGCSPMSVYTTREDILARCLGIGMNDYVSFAAGECDFESDEFIGLLKFAALFPETFDWDTYDWEKDSDEISLAEGRQMLTTAWVSGVDDVVYNECYFGGLPYTYIGYPTTSGTGNYMTLSSGFAMSSSCADKQAVWQFLRTFFTDDFQKEQYNLPVSRTLFESRLKNAMTYELTRAQADKLTELVETTTRTLTGNETIEAIVKEQAGAFFRGEKSAEEVARLVQDEVSNYLSEQQ